MLYWLLSSEAMQRRLVREIREARTPLTARAPQARDAQRGPRSLDIANGVATIRVEGVLTPVPDMMAEYYGEPNSTYPDMQAALAEALAASDVKEIVWSINSPGGSVDGYFALIDDIAAAKAMPKAKPMRVLAGEAQSAAYGIAASVGKITATSRMASFGSVGVAVSGFVQGGLCGEVIDMTSSDAPEKRPDIKTPEGRAVVVKYLDQVAEEFMTAIADGRGVTRDAVASGFGRGSSMLARQAKEAGLIDDVVGRPAYARTLTNARTADTVRRIVMSEPVKQEPAAEPTEAEPETTEATEPVEDETEAEATPAPEAVPAPNASAKRSVPTIDGFMISPAEHAELVALRAERDSRETAERRALVTELVAMQAETPATAWANNAPTARLAAEPLPSLRDRVTALRAVKGITAAITPPPSGAGTAELYDFELRDAEKIKDPAAKQRFIASRIERKQKAL